MISREKIFEASSLLRGRVTRTPLLYSRYLSRRFGCEIHLKMENLQKTGSFKIRGATMKLLSLKDPGPLGVVAASAGNHAQGLALAASQLGIESTIVMPEWASISKQEATRNYGGQVITEGKSIAESLAKAEELARERRSFIHPFDDEDVIAGQATVGLEIFEDLARPDMIISPVGGGGLISGICLAASIKNPETRILGVQSSRCPSARNSLESGEVCTIGDRSTVADGINVTRIGDLCFRIMKRFVKEVVLVEDEQVAAAILMLLEYKKTLAEGAGAAPLAALLNGSVKPAPGSVVVLVVSGGNVDSPLLGRIVQQGLMEHGRIMHLSVSLADVPGALASFLGLVASCGANVLNIRHERSAKGLPLYVSRVELELETRGRDHSQKIAGRLAAAGYACELR